jgi:hypothetical protein
MNAGDTGSTMQRSRMASMSCVVDMPAFDIADRVKLTRVPGTPEGNRRTLIRPPAPTRGESPTGKITSTTVA